MLAQYLMGAVVSTARGEGVDMQRRHRRAGRALEQIPFFALPSTVAGAHGHTLAGGRAQRWPMEGTRESGEAAKGQLRLSRYCATLTPPQHAHVTGATLASPRSIHNVCALVFHC